MLPRIEPIRLKPLPSAFDRSNWIYEIKYDGFRAVAYVEDGTCRLVSRKGHVYDRFEHLCKRIGENLQVQNAILDGEVVCIYVDHLAENGTALFDHVCTMDLEGIVAKPAASPYKTTVPWHKIKNPDYSQAEGRGELFQRTQR